MAKIGSFKKVSDELRGDITTLTFQAKAVRITPEDDVRGDAPTHRVFYRDVEVGAAWTRKSKDERPYLSVKIDDPSFIAPIYARLHEGDEGECDLVWTRSVPRGGRD